jgi:hypothetical protein
MVRNAIICFSYVAFQALTRKTTSSTGQKSRKFELTEEQKQEIREVSIC